MTQREVLPAQRMEVLPSAHAGRWKEAAEPGPGYLLALWGSGTFHSHHGKGVPMQRDTCPGPESPGAEVSNSTSHTKAGDLDLTGGIQDEALSTVQSTQGKLAPEIMSSDVNRGRAQRNLKGDSRWHLQCKEVTVHVFTS